MQTVMVNAPKTLTLKIEGSIAAFPLPFNENSSNIVHVVLKEILLPCTDTVFRKA
jgi:hypothetical protein